MTSITLEAFAAYVEELPSRSRCWRSGSVGLYPVLGWLNTQPVVTQSQIVAEHGPELGALLSTRGLHNAVGTAVAWATRYMVGPAQRTPTNSRDLTGLLDLAGRVYIMRNLLAEVRQGVRTFEVTRRRIEMRFIGDARLDALDRLLALTDDITAENLVRQPSSRFTEWMREHGTATPWEALPPWVSSEYRRMAHAFMEASPSYLPPGLDAGGFTIADADAVLEELLARGQHMMSATILGSADVATTVPCFEIAALVKDLARETGVAPARVELICSLLTVDLARCPDPCLTPLVPLGKDFQFGPGYVVPMSSLIVPSSPHRNFTALLQIDPNRFGAAGRALGALGAETVASTLKGRLSGALVATGVQLVRPDRTRAGDLDVVACDVASRRMAVFEIMWRIGPDGSAEVAAVENDAHSKRQQVARVRYDVAEGRAAPRWPRHWPSVEGFAIDWFIVTPNVLPVRAVDNDGIHIRSHQLMSRTLPHGISLNELVARLAEPPYPPDELSETHRRDITIGRYTVTFDISNAAPG